VYNKWCKFCHYLGKLLSLFIDPHSRSRIGQIEQNGKSVLLKFYALQNVESYIKEIYVPPGQEMFLDTQYFRITTTNEIKYKIKLSIYLFNYQGHKETIKHKKRVS